MQIKSTLPPHFRGSEHFNKQKKQAKAPSVKHLGLNPSAVQFSAIPHKKKTGFFLSGLLALVFLPPSVNPIWQIPANCIAQNIVMPKSRTPHSQECQVLENLIQGPRLFHAQRLPHSMISDIIPTQAVQFKSPDGLKLRGFWSEAPQPSKKTMVLIHGLGMDSGMNAELAKEFHERGYNVLLFDLRSHGRSDGHRIKLGLTEGRDIAAAVEFLAKNKAEQSQFIGLYGHSMGAASIMQAPLALKEYPKALATLIKHVDSIVLDSSFASIDLMSIPAAKQSVAALWLRYINTELQEASKHYLGRTLASIDTITPFKSSALSQKDVLLVHGKQDRITPISHEKIIYKELSLNHPNVSELILDADHLADNYDPFNNKSRFISSVRDRPNFKQLYDFLDKSLAKSLNSHLKDPALAEAASKIKTL